MKNWKTTLFGTLTSVGLGVLHTAPSKEGWWAGLAMAVLGPVLLGAVSEDKPTKTDDRPTD